MDWLRRNKKLGDGECDGQWDCAEYAFDEGDCVHARQRDRQLQINCTAWRFPNTSLSRFQNWKAQSGAGAAASQAPPSSLLSQEEKMELRSVLVDCTDICTARARSLEPTPSAGAPTQA